MIKKYEDRKLVSHQELFSSVLQENKRQLDKFGVQVATLFEWSTWLTEELGELANAIIENNYNGGPLNDISTEAIEVATLALKIAEMTLAEVKKEK
ncbi:MAG: hypothetical protein ACW968_07550 [Candidatus Thorarchaeota archaeon]